MAIWLLRKKSLCTLLKHSNVLYNCAVQMYLGIYCIWGLQSQWGAIYFSAKAEEIKKKPGYVTCQSHVTSLAFNLYIKYREPNGPTPWPAVCEWAVNTCC